MHKKDLEPQLFDVFIIKPLSWYSVKFVNSENCLWFMKKYQAVHIMIMSAILQKRISLWFILTAVFKHLSNESNGTYSLFYLVKCFKNQVHVFRVIICSLFSPLTLHCQNRAVFCDTELARSIHIAFTRIKELLSIVNKQFVSEWTKADVSWNATYQLLLHISC
jgi:hypothetical protein